MHPDLKARFSCKTFKPEPIAPEALHSLLEAARWSPSAFNDQPWSFIVAPRQDAAAFAKLLACLGGNQVWAQDAAVLMACCVAKTYTRNGQPARHGWHDLGLAVMSMAVQGVSLGLQQREMAGIDSVLTRQAYGVPETHDVVTGLAIGVPSAPAPQGRERKALKEFVFSDVWGRPAPGLE